MTKRDGKMLPQPKRNEVMIWFQGGTEKWKFEEEWAEERKVKEAAE